MGQYHFSAVYFSVIIKTAFHFEKFLTLGDELYGHTTNKKTGGKKLCLENYTLKIIARLGMKYLRLKYKLSINALEKEMATHSSVLDWRIPGTGEPGGLSSMGSHRVGHD